MNERIRELAEQAGFQINPLKGLIHLPGLNPTANIQLEKFAELIVQKCLDVLNPDNDLTSMREEYGRKMSMQLIKEYFGVEE